MTDGTFSFLALGDSYTIGEGVAVRESFPCQALEILQGSGKRFHPPRILAKTGWTTRGLADAMALTTFLPSYDFVSLLIGVNNEYRGLGLEEYEREFGQLLRQAIRFCGDRTDHVFVLSIPDWGVTPFAAAHLPDAAGRDKGTIAREIDAFNAVAGRIALQQEVDFIDITQHIRLAPSDVAPDGLHPSPKEYRYWAEQLASRILDKL